MKRKCLWITLGTLSIIFCCFLLLIATYNKPIADQFSFINRTNDLGVFGLVSDLYQNNSGRIAQAINIGLSYKLFGDMQAQIIVPVLFYITLSLVFSWFYSLLLKCKDYHLAKSLILGSFSSGLILFCSPCLFDVYLWLDSGFVHLGGVISLIFETSLFIWMIKTPNFFKKKYFPILAITCCFCLLCNEATVALSLGWATIGLIITLFIKKFHEYRSATLTIFIISILSFLIMFCAPGTWARMGQEGGAANFLQIFFSFPYNAIVDIFTTWSLWQFCLVILLGIFIGNFIPSGKTRRWFLIAGLLSFLSITYGTSVVVFYGQKYSGLASRTMFTPNLGIIIAIVLITAAIYNIIANKLFPKEEKRLTISLCSIIFLSIISLYGFLKFNHNFISVLAVRENLVEKRESLIERYHNKKIDKLVLPDLPVMLSNSNASDFTVNNTTYYDWYYDNFAKYYKINPEDLTIIGGKIKSDLWETDTPSWYIDSEMQTCIENNYLIAPKYICSNQQ